ncbi:acyl carrier protein, partial [bacterium]|nr:acyl carrier protein [bacterium]
PDAHLKDDLGLESLDFVDIAVMARKKFGITIKGKDMLSLKTLGDVYDYIHRLVQMK